jgi:mono/diheme cytochrome c family protein
MNRLRLLALAAAAVCALLATWTLSRAQVPKGPGSGDATAGATMHDKDCVACHVRRMGGDGTRMYTRADRKVTTPEKLKAQIAVCNAELSTGYFPEEEEHIAAYLNLRFYKFKE